MRNRIKKYDRDNDDIERLLKEAEKSVKNVFSDLDLTELQDRDLPSWKIELQKVMLFEKYNKDIGEAINSSQDVSNLIGVLNAIANIVKDKEATDEIKAFLLYIFRFRLSSLILNRDDNERVGEVFNRKGEINPSPLRDYFLHEYLQGLTYDRFFAQKYRDLEAKGIDIDEYEENLTKEEQDKAGKEWDKRFAELCLKYGEEYLIDWQDDHKSILDKLPKDIKAGIDRVTAEMDREIEVMQKVETLKEEKGITEEEAVKLLRDEEREILKKGGLLEVEGENEKQA